MKRKITENAILTALGIFYLLIAFFPLVKSLFKKNTETYNEKESWVEVPLLIGE